MFTGSAHCSLMLSNVLLYTCTHPFIWHTLFADAEAFILSVTVSFIVKSFRNAHVCCVLLPQKEALSTNMFVAFG